MTLEKLKKMLADGTIDQKEYDSMVEKLGLKEDSKKDEDKKKEDEGKKDSGVPDNLQYLIQSAVDRATNKLGNENKKLREQLESLQKEKMSDDERKQFEFDAQVKALKLKEQELKEKELRMFAIKAIKDAGLDDGGDTALALVDLLMGESEDAITNKTASLKSLVDKSVKSQVEQRFKASGRDMGKGGDKVEGEDKGKDDDVAIKLAKATASNNKATQSIIQHYSGGKTE